MPSELLMPNKNTDALKVQTLCHRCVGQAYLSQEIKTEGKRRKCSYCGHVAKAYLIGDVAGRIAAAFEQHYRRTSDHPTSWQRSLQSDRESNYNWYREGEPVV